MFDAYAKPKPVSFVAGGQVEHRPGEAFPWLWKPYLAFGMLSVLDGDPGVGKSLITCDLAARLATGRPMPDGSPKASYPRPGQKHACTIFVNVDDSVQHVIVPRLFAAGCPPRVALFVSGVGEGAGESRAIRFPQDMAYLTSVLSQQDGLRGAFVVLDPVMAMMSGAAASSDQAIRATSEPARAPRGRIAIVHSARPPPQQDGREGRTLSRRRQHRPDRRVPHGTSRGRPPRRPGAARAVDDEVEHRPARRRWPTASRPYRSGPS